MNLAIKIAKYEKIIHNEKDQSKIRAAENAIIELTAKVNSFEDLIIIDEMVLDILEKV